jgi:AhpD family alkylhydroperoxidase
MPLRKNPEACMNRREIYLDIKETLGVIPAVFRETPDALLEEEWRLFKAVRLDSGIIPQKYRELIGLGIAVATNCRNSAYLHTELAKAFGATSEEIEEALHFSRETIAWNACLNGREVDAEEFKAEVNIMRDTLRAAQAHHQVARETEGLRTVTV